MPKKISRANPKTVLLVSDLEFRSARELVSGVSDFMREHTPWRLRFVTRTQNFTSETVRSLEANGIDGVIATTCGSSETRKALEGSSVPLVIFGLPNDELHARQNNIAFVRYDDESIGSLGAKYLHGLGCFASYAFVRSATRTYWAIMREKGFRAMTRTFGISPCVICYETVDELAQSVKSLPKPLAVMASFDRCAADVLSACQAEKLTVPGQVVVLGVDDDEFICPFSDPPLASIKPDHVQEGRIAARQLDRLMKGRTVAGPCVSVVGKPSNLKIIDRESAQPIPPTERLVREALAYIAREATSGIRVRDVVAHVNASRRLVDLRFRQMTGRSVLEEIQSVRFRKMTSLLANTRQSISSIVKASGFNSRAHLARMFKRRFGMSMGEYRRSKLLGTSKGRASLSR